MKNESLTESEEIVKEEETTAMSVQGFDALSTRTDTQKGIFTNIKDAKRLFNLENNVDNLLNDCEGMIIHVKDILIKTFKKPLKEPIVDEKTGEILKEFETSMSCIIIDEKGSSYATGSKMFTISLMRYLEMFKLDENGFDIKITKKKLDSGNKALSFELV